MPQIADPTTRVSALRLWPGVLFGALIPVLWFGLPIIAPGTPFGVLGAALCSLIVIVWWTFFSRAPRAERFGAIAVIAVALAVTWFLVDVSISNGAMGALLFVLAIPTIAIAIPIWAVATRQAAHGTRRISMVLAIALACGVWTLTRTDGMMGAGPAMLRWRWTPTAEERLLARGDDLPPALSEPMIARVEGPALSAPAIARVEAPAVEPAKPVEPEAGRVNDESPAPALSEHTIGRVEGWPGFRGSHRNSVITGVRIDTNWTQSPPVEMWRRPIGPGWSSFAVGSDVIYTQEQRGDEEIVAAYRITTGEPVWAHRDVARFWESNGGAGPRGTPTLHEGRIYALGATGIVNVLDAASGAVVWSHNVGQDTNVPVPMWGFSASPLIVGDAVVVAAAGTLAGYDRATGALRWTGPRYIGDGYSSPHLATIDGVTQVLMLSLAGTTSVAPEDGKVLWEYSWPAMGGPIVQPSVTADGDVLVTGLVGMSGGELRRLTVAQDRGEWRVTERWKATGLKPYFNDYVLHKGHAYGFDGSILACVDLADGVRKWKGGRYGAGQLVLLADQDLLLVISEEGELALVSATPNGFEAIARVPGIEGKTWNHPVLIGDVLLVRNGEEMAAFRLARLQ